MARLRSLATAEAAMAIFMGQAGGGASGGMRGFWTKSGAARLGRSIMRWQTGQGQMGRPWPPQRHALLGGESVIWMAANPVRRVPVIFTPGLLHAIWG